jgi:hypothetical protein
MGASMTCKEHALNAALFSSRAYFTSTMGLMLKLNLILPSAHFHLYKFNLYFIKLCCT